MKTTLTEWVKQQPDRLAALNEIKQVLYDLSPVQVHPVDFVRWIPIEKVEPNDYNPNKVASIELGLLLHSIQHDGYTQPIVTIYDPDRDRYVIVDGFHRYFVARSAPELLESTHGCLPCVVINKSFAERMASTVRHNRARGQHSVQGMASMVFKMLDEGMTDAEVCNELGMEAEELLKLKHITGFSKLFEDAEYNHSWKTRSQIRVEQQDRVERGLK